MHGHAGGDVCFDCVADSIGRGEVRRGQGVGEVSRVQDGVVPCAFVAAPVQGGEAIGVVRVCKGRQPASAVWCDWRLANSGGPLFHVLHID